MKGNKSAIFTFVLGFLVAIGTGVFAVMYKADPVDGLNDSVEGFLEELMVDEQAAYDLLDDGFTSVVSFAEFELNVDEFSEFEITKSRTGEEFGRPNEGHVIASLNNGRQIQFFLKLVNDQWDIVGIGFDVLDDEVKIDE